MTRVVTRLSTVRRILRGRVDDQQMLERGPKNSKKEQSKAKVKEKTCFFAELSGNKW